LIVYVESNFVLEIALRQEEYHHCRTILNRCLDQRTRLAIPAFALVESYGTLARRHESRERLFRELRDEFRQLARSGDYGRHTTAMNDATAVLAKSIEEEEERLSEVLGELLALASKIPLTGTVFGHADALKEQFKLRLPDALMLASVMAHLNEQLDETFLAPRRESERSPPPALEESCFVSKDRKDFDDPDIRALLDSRGCKLMFRFESALNYALRADASSPDQP
jgi:predicted nucleic acid-binding protein